MCSCMEDRKRTVDGRNFASKKILSRVGDRPTATILQVQFHFFDFCLVFYGKIFDQNMPLLEGPIIL